ncbi:MAG: hypothetical protein WAU77_04805 [Solirubrobacteraceae bacterium]
MMSRLVIPKTLRDELGVNGPTHLELTSYDGRLELTVADVLPRVEKRDGFPLIVTDQPMEPMSVAEARTPSRARR